jgi:hypothetical protein
MKDFTPAMVALQGLFHHESQVGSHKGPFVITDIAGVGFSFHESIPLLACGSRCGS